MTNQPPKLPPNIAAALQYRRRGWMVVPCPVLGDGHASDGKAPRKHAQWQKLRLSEADIPQAFGRADNVGVLLGEPSGNLADLDLDCIEAVRAAPLLLPPTPSMFGRKTAGLSHWLYIVPLSKASERFEDPAPPDGQDKMLCELRGTGGQTVFPPSLHVKSGETVSWWSAEGAQQLSPAEMRAKPLLEAISALAAVALIARRWGKGGRSELAMELAGWWSRAGMHRDRAEQLLTAVCTAAADDETRGRLETLRHTYAKREEQPEAELAGGGKLTERWGEAAMNKLSEWLGLARRGKNGQPGPRGGGGRGSAGFNPFRVEAELRLGCDDTGNAQRFVRRHLDQVLHCAELGGWHLWNGRCWELDRRERVPLMANAVAVDIEKEADKLTDPDERTVLLNWAGKSRDAPKVEALLKLARAGSGIAACADEMDARPELLAVANGTLDLSAPTGDPAAPFTLRASEPADRLTKCCPVEYDPAAQCPIWDKFLLRIFDGDAEMVQFMQRLAGYCLMGGNPEQRVAIFYGSGANGKSTLTNALHECFGGYAAHTAADVLMSRDNAGNNAFYALAQLRGVRYVTASEPEDGRKLAEGLVKAMTGGEAILARLSHQNFFAYKPLFTPILATNHLPRVYGSDEGIWRRILLLPFTVTIPAGERDPRLPEKLRAEYPGILRWALEGLACYRYFQEASGTGLLPPQSVETATGRYRSDQDVVGQWLEDCVQDVSAQEVTAFSAANDATLKDAHAAFEAWCEDNGVAGPRRNTFNSQLRARGWDSYKGAGNKNFWRGMVLR